MRPIQMQLSHKQKTFSQFFAPFLKSRLNFEYFFKKDDLQRFCISEITDSVNVVREMSKNINFRECFDKQHGKPAQALLNSALQGLFHIHWWLPSQLSWKSLSAWHAKSLECLLTHWLPMKNILFLIERI